MRTVAGREVLCIEHLMDTQIRSVNKFVTSVPVCVTSKQESYASYAEMQTARKCFDEICQETVLEAQSRAFELYHRFR
jgi:hypothetical protein